MNILEMRAAYPNLFHSQTWYDREAFAHEPLGAHAGTFYGGPLPAPAFESSPHLRGQALPPAVALVAAFLRTPLHDTWSKYLWCRDTDAKGQRVYVGGVSAENGWRIEIHRHLHLTEQWGCAKWS